eukprot:TRINITY_DN5323_c0_g1_i1.p1 TRINITY_DN5323_c0_g1~~TRINITY_DN5323_c0_g1_i1.p1  ORF type:complete len:367 (-),score=38.90 TRINITY_DN5323_c0_g1_i1:379-1479(-)
MGDENVSIICPICKCSGRENWVAIGCGHVFHAQCVLQWTENNQSCPICREKKSQLTTTLYMNFEECGASDTAVQDLEQFISLRKEIQQLKSEKGKLQDDVGIGQQVIESKQLQIVQLNSQYKTAVQEGTRWKTRFEQEQKSNSLKRLFDDITDRETDVILKQLQAGNCSGYIRKEKQRTQEQYRQLMKKYEESQRQLEKANQKLLMRRKEKIDNNISKNSDLKQNNSLQSKTQNLNLNSAKKRMFGELDRDVIEVSDDDDDNLSSFKNKQNKLNFEQKNKTVDNFKENQYKGDEDFAHFGKKVVYSQNNLSDSNFSFVQRSKKLTQYQYQQQQQQQQPWPPSFYQFEKKKAKRNHQSSIQDFLKPN